MSSLLTMWEVGGAAVTAIVALLTFLTGKENTKKGLALNVAWFGILCSILLAIRFECIPRLENAQRIASQMLDSRLATELLPRLLDTSRSPYYIDNQFLKVRIDSELDRLKETLERACKGSFEISKDDIAVFSDRLINSSKKSISATSYVKASDWWLTRWGKKYEDQNYELAKRGVHITRFFIFTSQKELDQLRDILLRHLSNKIDTFVIQNWESQISHTEDLIMVDDVICGRLILTPEKDMDHAEMSVHPTELRRVTGEFEKLRKVSIPADQVIGGK